MRCVPFLNARPVEYRVVAVMLLRPGYVFHPEHTLADLAEWEVRPGPHTYVPGGQVINRDVTNRAVWRVSDQLEAGSCVFLTEYSEPWLWYDFGCAVSAEVWGGPIRYARRYWWERLLRRPPRVLPYVPSNVFNSKFTVTIPDELVAAWVVWP